MEIVFSSPELVTLNITSPEVPGQTETVSPSISICIVDAPALRFPEIDVNIIIRSIRLSLFNSSNPLDPSLDLIPVYFYLFISFMSLIISK